MSKTYSIACTQCKKKLWIGQSGLGGEILYYGEPKMMETLKDFLFTHAGHQLVFDENMDSDMCRYEDVAP